MAAATTTSSVDSQIEIFVQEVLVNQMKEIREICFVCAWQTSMHIVHSKLI